MLGFEVVGEAWFLFERLLLLLRRGFNSWNCLDIKVVRHCILFVPFYVFYSHSCLWMVLVTEEVIWVICAVFIIMTEITAPATSFLFLHVIIPWPCLRQRKHLGIGNVYCCTMYHVWPVATLSRKGPLKVILRYFIGNHFFVLCLSMVNLFILITFTISLSCPSNGLILSVISFGSSSVFTW